MPALGPGPSADTRKHVRWRSPWVIVPAAIVVLYLTGLLDDGFLYLERRYYAPWSVGEDALTGMWEGTVQDAAGPRKMLLSVALRLAVRGSRTRRGNWTRSHHLQIDDGEIQLQGTLTVCAGEAKGDRAVQYELTGWANGDASNVRLWPAEAVPAARFSVESLSGAWHGHKLPGSMTYILRGNLAPPHATADSDRNALTASAGKRTVPVAFTKLAPRAAAPHC